MSKAIGRVTNSKLPESTRSAIMKFMAENEGEVVVVEVRPYKKRRSNAQNAFWFSIALPIITKMFLDAGASVDDKDVHEWIKINVWKLTKIVKAPDGTNHKISLSSALLNKDEWQEKLEITRSWAAEYGILIPFPNEGFLYPGEDAYG